MNVANLEFPASSHFRGLRDEDIVGCDRCRQGVRARKAWADTFNDLFYCWKCALVLINEANGDDVAMSKWKNRKKGSVK